MPRVLIPTPLRKFTSNEAEVDLKGDTIIAAFRIWWSNIPPLKLPLRWGGGQAFYQSI